MQETDENKVHEKIGKFFIKDVALNTGFTVVVVICQCSRQDERYGSCDVAGGEQGGLVSDTGRHKL